MHDESPESNTTPAASIHAASDHAASDHVVRAGASNTAETTAADSHDADHSTLPSTGWDDASDADLLTYTRAGDGAAFGELWRRHSRAARTVARSFTSSLDPDDLVQESFAKIYQALQKGGGPTGAFRPYLFTTVRNTASAWGRARREASIDTLESFEDPASRDEETMAALDRSLTATAFRSLPTRWQEVLWYCEVEQMTPQQVAPLLAMKPNAVAALAYRAREGLRQAWIQAHIAAVPEDSEHRWTIERIGTYTRGSLGKRDAAKLESHLDSCARCTIVAAEAREVGSRIALVLLPLAAGTAGATGYLAWMQTGSHTAVAATAMPAAIIGGHGMGVGVGIDPSVLGSLATGVGGAGAGSVATGAGSAGSAASASAGTSTAAGVGTSAGAGAGAGAGAAGTAATGAASVGAMASGVVSGAIALVAASAVAAAVALGPGFLSGPPATIVAETSSGPSAPQLPSPTPTSAATSPSEAPQPDATPAPTAPPAPEASSPAAPAPGSDAAPTPQPVPPVRPGTPSTTPSAGPTVPTEPTEPPVVPVPSQPLAYSIDQGAHDELYPLVSGIAEPGATVEVRRSGASVAQVEADEDGAWSTSRLAGTPVGESVLSIRQTTRSGAVEEVSHSITMAAPPTILSPSDGETISAFDLSIRLSGIPWTTAYGRIDGVPAFECTFAAGSEDLACEWITDWVEFGLGEHEVAVSYGDSAAEAPVSAINVTVVLVEEDDVPAEARSLPSSQRSNDPATDSTTRESETRGAPDSDTSDADGSAPARPEPVEAAPVETTPEETAPEEIAAEEPAPEETAPEESASQEPDLEATEPDDTEPASPGPARTDEASDD